VSLRHRMKNNNLNIVIFHNKMPPEGELINHNEGQCTTYFEMVIYTFNRGPSKKFHNTNAH